VCVCVCVWGGGGWGIMVKYTKSLLYNQRDFMSLLSVISYFSGN
jgi:predicted Rossmann-fold nucleotide-binding protein